MSIIFNSPKPLLKGIRTELMKYLMRDYSPIFDSLMLKLSSISNKEDFYIPDVVPGLTEHIDVIKGKSFKDFKYQIDIKAFVDAILVNRDTLDDSKSTLGLGLENHIKSIVEEWKDFPDELINNLLLNGDTNLAFDGTAFFADSRPNLQGSETIDNIVSGSGITDANLQTDMVDAKGKIRSFKDRNGKPWNKRVEYVVVCPAHLEDKFVKLANSEYINFGSGAETNNQKGTFKIITNNYQAISNNDWYLFNIARSKPFTFVDRGTPNFEMIDMLDNPDIKYVFRGRLGVGYGSPLCAVKINN